MSILTVEIQKVTFYKKDTGFAIVACTLDPEQPTDADVPEWMTNKGQFTVTGTFDKVNPGDLYDIEGTDILDPKYGWQFKAAVANVCVRRDERCLGAFLRKLPHIGVTRAQAIIKYFKGADRVFEVLDHTPERLAEINGITAERAVEIADKFKSLAGMRADWLFCRELKLDQMVSLRIINEFEGMARSVILDNPFSLMQRIGLSFKICDEIRRTLEITEDDNRRLAAGVVYVLESVTRQGHCYTSIDELQNPRDNQVRRIRESIGFTEEQFNRGLTLKPYDIRFLDDNNVSLERICQAEETIAEFMLSTNEVDCLGLPEDFFDLYPSIDPKQRRAVIETVKSRAVILTGGPGCISGDTIISVESEARRGGGGRPYTVSDAYYKFNRIARDQRGGKRFWNDKVYTLSLFPDGGINYNQIVDIIFSGQKEVFEVKSKNGRVLLATADHPFLTSDSTLGDSGYVELANLSVGSKIVCRRADRKPVKTKGRNTEYRQELHVPFHPHSRRKRVTTPMSRLDRSKTKTYQYNLVRTARLVVEASLNGLTLDEFVAKLQVASDGLTFLEPSIEVHHKDGDVTNNSLTNLEQLTGSAHAREHGQQNRKHFGNQTTEIDEIVSITSVGIQDTYDLVMAEPARNFVAGGFVVHNCGKTFTTNLILDLFDHNGLVSLCCAPTGKAAVRMRELTGREAFTVHRVLHHKPKDQKYLEVDAVIIDEASMVDVELFAQLLKVIPPKARVLIVGDVDQLPSIGPGRVFYDLIESERIPVVRLTTIFRQASDSRIPYVAREINSGELPDLCSTARTDFVWGESNESIVEQIVVAVKSVIPERRGIPTNEIQVLCPQRESDVGYEALNNRLQQELNPNWSADRKAGVTAGRGCRLFEGDRVIHANQNNYQLDVANGEIGIVERADWRKFKAPEGVVCNSKIGDAVTVIVNFGGRRVGFNMLEKRNLELAYAITIHKSQGSSFKAVIMPVHSQNQFMLTRPLIYTAVTRAEKLLVLFGEQVAFEKAIRNTRGVARRTRLIDLLRSEQ